MLAADSIAFPLIATALVILGAIIIKLLFQRDKELPNSSDLRPAARFRNGILVPGTLIFLGLGAYIGYQYLSFVDGYVPELKPFFLLFGATFFFQIIIAVLSRKFTRSSFSSQQLKDVPGAHIPSHDTLRPIVMIPVYNEDETSLTNNLRALFDQTVPPAEIHVVDDGSKNDLSQVEAWFLNEAAAHNITVTWTRQENQGKRMAHATAYNNIFDRTNAIIVTVDSDGVLDRNALEEGLIPFERPEVYSVAGVVVASNAQKNFLARITDMMFVAGQQLVDRQAQSAFGNVIVNSGGLALYRIAAVDAAMETGYTEEDFFGSHVVFSDDSYFTLMALKLGKTVQQPSAIVFADMPENLSHHVRQQLRWARGSFIRGWWRVRHLDPLSYAWIRQVLGYVLFFSMTVVVLQIILFKPITTGELPPWQFVLIPVFLSYIQGVRYFTIERSDMSNSSQFLTYLLSPFSILWSMFVLRPIRLWGFITCRKTGWNTRQSVEIVHETPQPSGFVAPGGAGTVAAG
ncbi:glycosyltransferase [Corynebacterium cystitidis]|uniref:glycosyltransferase n=1 Tax=Corynebacterium cystitidis TaxID=35757 RepID=UPI00211DEC1E|nr:glycosyltransferase [Corynebacterium cystitidis]